MPQSPWSFSFAGDPQDALTAANSISGILPKELVSLEELINTFSECTPPATNVVVSASETLANGQAFITQTATFNSVAEGGNWEYEDSGSPLDVKSNLKNHKGEIEQWPRWSGCNACDQAHLSGVASITLQMSQKVLSATTVVSIAYSF